jgi:hypothetical protein
MKQHKLLPLFALCLALPLQAATTFTDAVNEIDPGIANGGGTLDIVQMEVSNTATDLLFSLTLNGNTSTGGNDWGMFMIGISTGSTLSTNTSNGWVRPIQLNSPLGGMDYWVGSWVNGAGGSQLWDYDGASWTNNGALPGYSFTPGAQSTIAYTVSLSSLGLLAGETFYFDAYSSGGGGGDSAVDALSNPNVSITSWSQTYTSDGTSGLSSYTLVPEPTAFGLVALGALAIGLRRRR